MKIGSLIATASLVVGAASGVAVYQSVSARQPDIEPVSVNRPSEPSPAPSIAPGVVFGWEPCEPPAVQEGQACVTTVEQTVTLPAPAPAGGQPAPTPSSGGNDSDDDSSYDDSDDSYDDSYEEDEDEPDEEDEPDDEDEAEDD